MPRRALLLATALAACSSQPQVEILTRSGPETAEAEAWAAADPYMTTGVFTRCTVKPFRKTLP